jgi:hypothetical protein
LPFIVSVFVNGWVVPVAVIATDVPHDPATDDTALLDCVIVDVSEKSAPTTRFGSDAGVHKPLAGLRLRDATPEPGVSTVPPPRISAGAI